MELQTYVKDNHTVGLCWNPEVRVTVEPLYQDTLNSGHLYKQNTVSNDIFVYLISETRTFHYSGHFNLIMYRKMCIIMSNSQGPILTAGIGAPPPPPGGLRAPPPPPPPAVVPPDGAAPSADGGGKETARSALLSELSKGADVTKGKCITNWDIN